MADTRVDVVGLGENSVDTVYRLSAYPSPAGPITKARILEETVSPGGQVATALSACAAFGRSTRYLGRFGSDARGERIRAELQSRGVDLSMARVRGVANRHAVILLDDRSAERVVLWQRDPQLALGPHDVPAAAITSARLLHVDDIDVDASLAAAGIARTAGIPVTSDIDQITPHTEALLTAVTIPILAEHVPTALTGEPDTEDALRQLSQRHGGMLCVTLGARGSMLIDGDRLYRVPAPRVQVVDSTGAGDVFRGAFIHALLRGDAPTEILRFANAAAAVSCTRPGAIGGVPSLEEVEGVLRGWVAG